MRLFIPPLKTVLELTADWTAVLYVEHRNHALLVALGRTDVQRYMWRDVPGPSKYVFEAGTQLALDRIYIRAGAKDFDSLTFRVVRHPKLKGKRFWVKLANANELEVRVVSKEKPDA